MRAMIAVAGGLLAAGAAISGTPPSKPAVRVGREARKAPTSAPGVRPDDVTVVMENGARYFTDGALVGFWRSLRAHQVVELDGEVATIEPDWDGNFVPPAQSAAAWAERESSKGRYVLGPVLLAFDTGAERFLLSADSDEPAKGDALAVVLPPKAAGHIRALANQSESGG